MKNKRRNQTVPITPEQRALTCNSADEAFSYGLEVHRAYIQNKITNLNEDEQQLLGQLFARLNENKGSQKEQEELLKAVLSATSAEEAVKLIEDE